MSLGKDRQESGTACSHRDTDDLLKNVPSELMKYVVDKELQHTDDFIFCVRISTFIYFTAFRDGAWLGRYSVAVKL